MRGLRIIKFILLNVFVFIFVLEASDIYESQDGWRMSPRGEYRFLTIMVNVIYPDSDKTGENLDPRPEANGIWDPATKEGINNQSIPTYLKDFLDVEYDPDNVNGVMTRLYHESSFGELVILGDFIVVNINKSRITPNDVKEEFHISNARNYIIDFINNNGGLNNALYGYDRIADYDSNGDGNIDMIQFLWRNTNSKFGGVGSGTGHAGVYRYEIKENNILKEQRSNFTNQGVGNRYGPLNPNGIVVHEISHQFFGGNTFHTSGGNHYRRGRINTFFGTEGGYGLMGNYHSGLVSCNGYERWRMNWTSEKYNPEGYPIQANKKPSDISRDDGEKTFILRDFVTTGDAVRIKLPYVDEGASNQYLWLENHQIGRNEKLDYLHYSIRHNGETWHDCRHMGAPGIYSYIQVGKDVLKGKRSEVYPTNETDNLRIVSAEGNWDFKKMDDERVRCVASGYLYTAKRYLPNPLSGYQDQTTHFYPSNPNQIKLSGDDGHLLNIKYDSDGKTLINNSLPYLGDELDAFTGDAVIGIGTNPAPVNLTTYYVTQEGGNFKIAEENTNTSHVYLTGLNIKMKEKQDGTFEVNVNWDGYDINNDVRWAGNIVLKENLILKEGNTLKIDQSLTPNQIYRNEISNLFAKPSVLSCKENSRFIVEDNAEVELKNKSTLHLEEGSYFDIGKNSELTVNKGDTLKIDELAQLVIRENGIINIERGGVLCLSENAIILPESGQKNFNLRRGYIIPENCIHPFQVIK